MVQFNSFAELARVYGNKEKAQEKMAYGPFVKIEKELGVKEAVLWSLVQDREARGVYGDKGAIVVTPAMLVEESGYSYPKVTGALLNLLQSSYLRPTVDGKAVKAA